MARRGKKGSCSMVVVTDNGKDSILHKELLNRYKNRNFDNYVYATYKLTSVQQAMDLAGYKRNNTNEHNIDDVIKFLGVNEAYNDMQENSIRRLATNLLLIDSNGNLVDFFDSEVALDKAVLYNNANHKGSFAMVVLNGDKFNVRIIPLDTSTHTMKEKTALDKLIWDFTKNELIRYGIDLTSAEIDKEKFNTTRALNIANWMRNIKNTSNDLLLTDDIRALLSTNVNSSQVQRLINLFGNYGSTATTVLELLSNVAKAIYDFYRNNLPNSTPGQGTLIESTLNNCKDFGGIDVNAFDNLVKSMRGTFNNNSLESGIETTLKDLERKYKINANELGKIGHEINSLMDAAIMASFTLKRQKAEILYYEGVNEDVLRLDSALNQVMEEINNNRYTYGLVAFLQEAKTLLIGSVSSQGVPLPGLYNKLLSLANVLGTALEKGKKRSDILTELKLFNDGYLNIIESLVNIDTLQNTTIEIINPVIKDLILQLAKELYDKYLSLKKDIDRVAKETVTDLAIEYLGDTLYNGTSIMDIIEMQESDSTLYDNLYAMSRVSNPLINVMGNIVEEMRNLKDAKMLDIALRIRRERYALRKAGMNDKWMYGLDGYIISEYDISAYNKARERAWGQFKKRGLTGLRLDAAMDNWVEQNSEEIVVDFKNGRKERVPGLAFRRAMPQLNAAQLRYYTNMMQIKAELGSMLPEYARRQFVPPQLRKTWTDSMIDAMKNRKDLKGYLKMLNEWVRVTKNKVRGLWHVWEDDTEYIANGILEGQDVNIVDGAMDNTPFRRIPIFYINNVDSRDLVHDFAGALQHLAGTAINYECVNNIKNTIERMGDYISDPNRISAKRKGLRQFDWIEDKRIRLFKALSSKARSTGNGALIDALIEKHIYGIELKNQKKYTKFLKNMLMYNSMRNLAVNVKGAFNNYIVGEYQMFMEAVSGSMLNGLSMFKYKGRPLVKRKAEFYTLSDYIWAHIMMFANNRSAINRLVDYTVGNKNSKVVLLSLFFNPELENFNELAHERYYTTWMRRWLSKDRTFVGYGIGEHLIHNVNMYSVLHNTKVKLNGKETNLHKVLYVKNKVDGNGELGIMDGATYEMPDGSEVPVDMEFLEAIKGMIKYINQNTHGSMNAGDKGVVHLKMTMRYVMNLRQWMVEHYSRRFRDEHYDATLNKASQKLNISKVRQGHLNTAYRVAWNYTKMGLVSKFLNSFGIQAERMKTDAALRWTNLRPDQQQNVLRTIAELTLAAMLSMLSTRLDVWKDDLDFDDDDKYLGFSLKWWFNNFFYQLKRTNFDAWAAIPSPKSFNELNTLINSPISATNTFNATLYPIYGLDTDWGEELSDRQNDVMPFSEDKTWNDTDGKKYWYKVYKYFVPFTKQIQQFRHFDEEDDLFKVFDKLAL